MKAKLEKVENLIRQKDEQPKVKIMKAYKEKVDLDPCHTQNVSYIFKIRRYFDNLTILSHGFQWQTKVSSEKMYHTC